jgi:hypothetical protein
MFPLIDTHTQDRTEVNKGTNRRGGEIMYNHSEKAFISQKQFNTIPKNKHLSR